jgi:hypothetical protein
VRHTAQGTGGTAALSIEKEIPNLMEATGNSGFDAAVLAAECARRVARAAAPGNAGAFLVEQIFKR